jgi:hypothetical protein
LPTSSRHPSVRALLNDHGGTDAVAAIRSRARALVAKATALGWEGPPFDVGELASLCGLTVSYDAELHADQDACVMPGLILLNPAKPRVRQRYSLAHEVGHTLFPDYSAELKRAGRLWRRDGDESEFEQLCQVAGAELLMPLGPFRHAVELEGHDLASVLRLADVFDASLEAIARRLVETETTQAIGLLIKPIDRTTGEWIVVDPGTNHTPYASLAVFSSWTSDACNGLRIDRGTAPPKNGAVDRAWKRVILSKGRVLIEHRAPEDWGHAGVTGAWDAEALTVPKAAGVPREVLALMRPITA